MTGELAHSATSASSCGRYVDLGFRGRKVTAVRHDGMSSTNRVAVETARSTQTHDGRTYRTHRLGACVMWRRELMRVALAFTGAIWVESCRRVSALGSEFLCMILHIPPSIGIA